MYISRLHVVPVVYAMGLAASCAAEPTITKGKNVFGRTVSIQDYEIPASELEWKRLSLARRIYAWRPMAGSTDSGATVRITCPLNPSGDLTAYACAPTRQRQDPNAPWPPSVQVASRLVKQALLPSAVAPAIDAKLAAELQRTASFDVVIDPSAQPQFDPAQGELLPMDKFEGFQLAQFGHDYPPAALRKQLAARVTVRCQVQQDYSAACSVIDVTPPENAKYFDDWVVERMLRFTIGKTLVGGGDSAGKRFTFGLTYQLPD